MKKVLVIFFASFLLLSCGEPISLDQKFDQENYGSHLIELEDNYPNLFDGYSWFDLKEPINNNDSLRGSFQGKTYREVIPVLVKEYKIIIAEEERIKEEERVAEEKELAIQEEKERVEQEIYNKYINNSLSTGSTPYSYCFGKNRSCSEWGCAGISVKTPSNSDVLVTIKKNGEVVRHAFVKAGNSYKFEFPNGTYQAFFYYGKGWNPNKFMKKTKCGELNGGFIEDESFSKDTPQQLTNQVLSYELILQSNGNFSTKPSNKNEAF
jgi:hypothetical protein